MSSSRTPSLSGRGSGMGGRGGTGFVGRGSQRNSTENHNRDPAASSLPTAATPAVPTQVPPVRIHVQNRNTSNHNNADFGVTSTKTATRTSVSPSPSTATTEEQNPSSAREYKRSNTPQIPMSGVPYGCLPSFLAGSASLVEQLDRRLMIVLRDGKHLVGILRSFDQFSNMVLENTSERRLLMVRKSRGHLPKRQVEQEDDYASTANLICYYTDVHLGLYIVRGDALVLFGEAEEEEEEDIGKEEEEGATTTVGVVPMNTGIHGELNHLEQASGTISSMVKKKYMKRVTLEEFENLAKEYSNDGGKNPSEKMEPLTWEFDMDLVV